MLRTGNGGFASAHALGHATYGIRRAAPAFSAHGTMATVMPVNII